MKEIAKSYRNKFQYYDRFSSLKLGSLANEFTLELTEFFDIFDHNINEIKYILNSYNFVFYNFEVELSENKNAIVYSNSDIEINSLKNYYRKFGYLPLSIELFYNKFEQIDFRGFFEDCEYNFCLDSLTIMPPSSIINFNGEPYEDNFIRNEDSGKIGLIFSLDEYFKENISGGGGYSMDLSSIQMVDDNIQYYKQKLTLINYLRFSVYYGCFPNLSFQIENIPNKLKEYLTDVNNRIIKF